MRGAAQMLGQPRSKLQRRGASGKIFQQVIEFLLETRVLARLGVGALEFLERRDERFRNVAAAVRAEAALRVRPDLWSGGHGFLIQANVMRAWQPEFSPAAKIAARVGQASACRFLCGVPEPDRLKPVH